MFFVRIFFLCGFVALTSSVFGQSSFEGRVGLGIGYFPGWDFNKFVELNRSISMARLETFNNDGFYYHGWGGYLYAMFIPNLRIGFTQFTGYKTSSPEISGKSVEYEINSTGLTIEYTSSIKSVNVSFGGIIGYGEQIIKNRINVYKPDWNNIWRDIEKDTINVINGEYYFNKISANYFTFTPTINVEYSLSRFTALRMGIGYIFNFPSQWKLNEVYTISNVPKNLNGNSFYICGGILIGFFSN